MSVTYPADATATTYLFTLRGKVNMPTVADARELHNKTAGSADGIAAARALGDLSHNVYTSAGNGAGSDEVLIIDYWNSPSGFGQFFADPQVQAGAELLFTEREGILWAPTSGFGDFHLALPSGASPTAVGLLRAGVASLEPAAAAFDADQMNAYYELGIGFEHFGPVFAGEPQTSVWQAAQGQWTEW